MCKLVACAVVIFGGVYVLCAGQYNQNHLKKNHYSNTVNNFILGKTDHFSNPFQGTTTSPKDFALAFYSGLWAYDGWNTVTSVTEEVKNPEKYALLFSPAIKPIFCS